MWPNTNKIYKLLYGQEIKQNEDVLENTLYGT